MLRQVTLRAFLMATLTSLRLPLQTGSVVRKRCQRGRERSILVVRQNQRTVS